jgi:hypothetical protein
MFKISLYIMFRSICLLHVLTQFCVELRTCINDHELIPSKIENPTKLYESLRMRMATAICAETLDNFQLLMQLIPRS